MTLCMDGFKRCFGAEEAPSRMFRGCDNTEDVCQIPLRKTNVQATSVLQQGPKYGP